MEVTRAMTNDEKDRDASGVALTAGLGGHQIERDTSGPVGTYGCACMSDDAVECAAIRYGMDHWGEACECLCHQWRDDDGY